ncbi:MAG TPA: hypothetical protein VGL62_05310 [Vicinamibacterales bacterium]
MSPFLPATLILTLLGGPAAVPVPPRPHVTVLRDAVARQARAGLVLAQLRPGPVMATPHVSSIGEKIGAAIVGGLIGFSAGYGVGYALGCSGGCSGTPVEVGAVSGVALGSWLGVWLASR